jgi:NADPH:quinone reductase
MFCGKQRRAVAGVRSFPRSTMEVTMQTKQRTMRAMTLGRFGGIGELRSGELPVPDIGPKEILLRVQAAGVGEWDAFEREGGYAKMLGVEAAFPYVLGSEGAGVVEAVGKDVTNVAVGDTVYAVGFLNPKGGFYAEYAAVPAATTAPVPSGMSLEQAAAMGGVGITALRGLDEVIGLRRGESIAVVGASGGIGHLAVQLAKHRGARVLAVASGKDGVALAASLGADAAIDGHEEDVRAAARTFAPEGLDAALITASGDALDRLLTGLRSGGRAAYPNGVEPAPQAPPGVSLKSYNGEPDATIVASFQREIEERAITVHVARSFPLEQAADAHRALDQHYLGKLVLTVTARPGTALA